MKLLVFSFLILFNYTLFAQQPAVKVANAQKRTLSGSFTSIMVSDGIDLFLTQGKTESISVNASDEKYLERFKTEVENGILKIYYSSKGLEWPGNSKRKLTAYISFKNLNLIKASGRAQVMAKNNFTLKDINLQFFSGSIFNGKIKANNVTVDQNSGSNINIAGKASSLKIDASVGASFKGFDLQVDVCEAKAKTGATILINVNKELNAKAVTVGSIHYKGKAVIINIKTGSGGVVAREG
jgi:hypothetical protein